MKRATPSASKQPKTKKSRGPTRAHIPTGREFAFDADVVSNNISLPPPPLQGTAAAPRDDAIFPSPCAAVVRPIVRAQTYPVILTEVAPSHQIDLYASYRGCCWWDHHPYSGPWVGCPIKYNEYIKRYWLEGFFCSWSCALAYVSTLPTHRAALCRHYLHRLVKDIKKHQQRPRSGDDTSYLHVYPDIQQAPHWSCLRNHGGTMTIDEFRRSTDATADNHVTLSTCADRLSIIPVGYSVYVRDERKRLNGFQMERCLPMEPVLPSLTPANLVVPCSRHPVTVKPENRVNIPWPKKFDPVRLQRKHKREEDARKVTEMVNATRAKPLKGNSLLRSMNVRVKPTCT
jgi:hypothetical protein